MTQKQNKTYQTLQKSKTLKEQNQRNIEKENMIQIKKKNQICFRVPLNI